MKEFFRQYKSTILFIVKFLAVYGILSVVYAWYLDLYPTELDPASCVVTEQATKGMQLFEPKITYDLKEGYPRADMKFVGHTFQYIIEGCNAISVMILFLAFIVAFKAKWIHYVWFVPFGLLVIHWTNIARIGILGFAALYYPEYSKPMHDYFFPGMIYGITMLLWFLWVKYVAR
ncbi:exosortase family protein XrtF [Salibacter halophilus]|uniref:Exosortase family protein XrtF n=1 Tax=Salibacter halophilus TaxID=1803916 RepID=A0A6N6MC71_9FLAO|nr:exosortase family protein XrtF [Salibacter halophilus]KAB1064914.1 exosortase family protein XrtF [Salibacter halophilus]